MIICQMTMTTVTPVLERNSCCKFSLSFLLKTYSEVFKSRFKYLFYRNNRRFIGCHRKGKQCIITETNYISYRLALKKKVLSSFRFFAQAHACMLVAFRNSIYLSNYIPPYLPTYLSTYLYTYLPNYLPTYLPTYLSTYLHT